MKHRRLRPHPLLADHVACLWLSERHFAPPDDAFPLLPDSHAELAFTEGDCALEVGGRRYRLRGGYLLPLLDRPARLRGRGLVRTVAARLYAWGFAGLFGRAPTPGRPLRLPRELQAERVSAALQAGDVEGALALLHALLQAQAARRAAGPLLAASRRLLEGRERFALGELASLAGRSPRQVERGLKRLTGLSPKALARRRRFQRARDALAAAPDARLGELALACGYADQAHLNREFREFAGRTPRQFAKQMAALRAGPRVVFLQD